MNETREIYKKLGLKIDYYQGPGGEDYKQFKLQRFKDRLKVCLYFERCLEAKGLAFQNLSELAFSSKEDRIQLIVKYKGEEHDLVEFVKTFRKKCLNQKEKCRVKNLLCLKVLTTFIQDGKISLD